MKGEVVWVVLLVGMPLVGMHDSGSQDAARESAHERITFVGSDGRELSMSGSAVRDLPIVQRYVQSVGTTAGGRLIVRDITPDALAMIVALARLHRGSYADEITAYFKATGRLDVPLTKRALEQKIVQDLHVANVSKDDLKKCFSNAILQAIARQTWLLYNEDIGPEFGVDLGSFSVWELLRYSKIPAVHQVDSLGGMYSLKMDALKIRDLDGLTSIANIHKAEDIYVDGNSIDKLKARQLQGLVNLRWLTLINNKIRHISPGAFQGLLQLKELDLSGNNVTWQPGAFEGLPHTLEKLSLAHNNLSRLPDHGLRGLCVVNTLDLSHNRLQRVRPEALQGVTKVNRLVLSGNPFRSDQLEKLKHMPVVAEIDYEATY